MTTVLHAFDYSVYYSSWRFAQGFILGQIFVIALIILVIRYLLLDDPTAVSKRRSASSRRASLHRSMNLGAQGATPPVSAPTSAIRQSLRRLESFVGNLPPFAEPNPLDFTTRANHVANMRQGNAQHPDIRHLFEHIGLNFAHAKTESCEWINLFVAQALLRYRANTTLQNLWIHRLTKWVNSPEVRPSLLSPITITALHFGTGFPIIKSVKIHPLVNENTLQWHFSVDLSDQLAVGIDVKILLNWPKSSLAALPVSLVVSLVKFTGKISVEFLPNDPLSVAVSVLPGYELELDTQSLIGHRAKVQSLPKIKELIEGRILAEFDKHLVAPAFKIIPLPTFLSSGGSASRRSAATTATDPPSGTDAKIRSRPFRWSETQT